MGYLRKHLGLILRAGISIGILVVIGFRVDWPELMEAFRTMDWAWVGAAFLLFGVVIGFAVLRWDLLLRVHGIRLPWVKIAEIWMIGHFFNAFLLGTTGGDVAKIYYCAAALPEQRSAAALSIIFDRILGLFVLLSIAVVLGGWHYQILDADPVTHKALLGIFVSFLAMLVGLFVFFVPAAWQMFFGLLKRFAPHHLQDTVNNVHEAFTRYTQSWGTNLLAVLISLILHMLTFIMSFFLLKALHAHDVPFWPFVSCLPIIGFLVAIPISISGLGMREGLFVSFLGLLKVNKETALAFSLGGFGVTLLWSLIGGIIYLRYKKPEDTFSKIEHSRDNAS
jgi:uncharacterized protein (TIRG00374 family)